MRALLFLIAVLIGATALGQVQMVPRPGPNGAYRIGAGVSAPVVVEKTEPQYTDEARTAKLEGVVILSLVVGEDGKARDMRIVRSLEPGLDDNAMKSVATWRFQPGKLEGKPVPVMATVEVSFRLLVNPGAWHLVHAAFSRPEGASLPHLVKAEYPSQSETKEYATVTLSLDVDEQGLPTNIRVEKSSDPKWESEVIRFVNYGWRFEPGTKDGKPVVVHATLDFAR